MIYRTLALLIVLIAVSVGLTYAIGEEVLVALGIVLVQLQILTKKLFTIEWAAIVLWLKTNTTLFLRVELLKKWATTSVCFAAIYGIGPTSSRICLGRHAAAQYPIPI